MIEALLYAFASGLVGGLIVNYLFLWWFRRSLYHLSVDVADLQERHLRAVRKAAAKERWEDQDEIDAKIAEAVTKQEQPKGWTKWPSLGRSANSSEGSSSR